MVTVKRIWDVIACLSHQLAALFGFLQFIPWNRRTEILYPIQIDTGAAVPLTSAVKKHWSESKALRFNTNITHNYSHQNAAVHDCSSSTRNTGCNFHLTGVRSFVLGALFSAWKKSSISLECKKSRFHLTGMRSFVPEALPKKSPVFPMQKLGSSAFCQLGKTGNVRFLPSLPTSHWHHHALLFWFFFFSDQGHVYAFGENKMAQLGLGSQSPYIPSPTKVSDFLLSFLLPNVDIWSKNKTIVAGVLSPGCFQCVSSVERFSFSTRCFMPNALQIKHGGPPIRRVACGAEFSMIVDIRGNLFSFGSPEYGQLGKQSALQFVKFTWSPAGSWRLRWAPRLCPERKKIYCERKLCKFLRKKRSNKQRNFFLFTFCRA